MISGYNPAPEDWYALSQEPTLLDKWNEEFDSFVNSLDKTWTSDPRMSIYIQCYNLLLGSHWSRMITDGLYPSSDTLDIKNGDSLCGYTGQKVLRFVGGIDGDLFWGAEDHNRITANTTVKMGTHQISTQKGAILSIFDSYPAQALKVCDFIYPDGYPLKLVNVLNFVISPDSYEIFLKKLRKQVGLNKAQTDRLLQCVIKIDGDDYTILLNNKTHNKQGFRVVHNGNIHFENIDDIPTAEEAEPVIKRLKMVRALLKKEGMEVHNGLLRW